MSLQDESGNYWPSIGDFYFVKKKKKKKERKKEKNRKKKEKKSLSSDISSLKIGTIIPAEKEPGLPQEAYTANWMIHLNIQSRPQH